MSPTKSDAVDRIAPFLSLVGGRKVRVSREGIAAFNARWPCSSLRDSRAYWFEFDAAGDLIDTDCPEQDDGPAAAALADDCQAWLESHPEKVYVGIDASGHRETFRAVFVSSTTHGARFVAVIGPFRTVRAAQFMCDHGHGNPHLQTVADAERISKNRALRGTAGR